MNVQVIILIAILVLCLFLYLKFFKIPKIGSLVLVSGGVKCGKSTTSVYFALKVYKKNLRSVKIKNFFRKIFKRPLLEEPLLYSNVPLKCKYVPLTKELLSRKVRFRYKSVIYIQEASLVADSQLISNQQLNTRLLLLNKLIAHETKGGTLIYDTQQLDDVHYSIKRSISNYFYIHSTQKWLPFFCIVRMREMLHNESDSINVITDDIEKSTQMFLVPKRVWKKFDCYCFSSLTDNLPVYDSVIDNSKNDNLKVDKLISFRDYSKFIDNVVDFKNDGVDIKNINQFLDKLNIEGDDGNEKK